LVGKELAKFPLAVEIQTASYCNGGCIICPYKTVAQDLPFGYMDQDLFEKIIKEISQYPETRIIPYFNNEPFLDCFFVERLRFIRAHCPSHVIELSTNISMLNKDVLDSMKGLYIDDLRISFFSLEKRSYKKIMTGLNWDTTRTNLKTLLETPKYRGLFGKIGLINIDIKEMTSSEIKNAKTFCEENNINYELWGFLDRAGNVKGRSNEIDKQIVKGCEQNRPLERMHVVFDGRVVLCCMDWRWENILGNINQNSLKGIWLSDDYDNLRKSIYNPDLSTPELCEKCKLAIE